MTNIGKQAPWLAGVHTVSNSTLRDTLYPSPDTDTVVRNLATGYLERYTGAAWLPDVALLGAGPIIDVTALGADKTGVTAASSVIQDAITSTGATVYFPAGTYLIDTALTLKSNLRLLGAPGATLTTTNATQIFTGTSLSNLVIDGLTLQGPGSGSGSGDGINLSTCDHVVIRNCYIKNFRDISPGGTGIVLTRCSYVVVANNVGDNAGIALVNVFACTNVAVVGNVHKNTRNAIPTTCVYCGGSAGSTACTDITVVGNVSDGDTYPYQVRVNCARIVYAGNVARNFVNMGMIAQASSGNPVTDVVFANNVVYGASGSTDGIVLDGATFSSVQGNAVSGGMTVSGISAVTTSGVNPTDDTISNNTIRSLGANAMGILTAANADRLQCVVNRIDSTNGNRGISVQGASNVVQGNVLTNIGFHAIELTAAATDSIVSGNWIKTTSGGGSGIVCAANNCTVTDNVIRSTAAAALNITGTSVLRTGNTTSTGASSGRAVLVAGTVTVSTAEVLASDNITLSRDVAGGTLGHLSIGTITAGTSFVINSSSATDTSTVYWEIRH